MVDDSWLSGYKALSLLSKWYNRALSADRSIVGSRIQTVTVLKLSSSIMASNAHRREFATSEFLSMTTSPCFTPPHRPSLGMYVRAWSFEPRALRCSSNRSSSRITETLVRGGSALASSRRNSFVSSSDIDRAGARNRLSSGFTSSTSWNSGCTGLAEYIGSSNFRDADRPTSFCHRIIRLLSSAGDGVTPLLSMKCWYDDLSFHRHRRLPTRGVNAHAVRGWPALELP